MALTVSCRLCTFPCDEYKCLYDANGGASEAYQAAIKYFHSALLDDVQMESALKVICLECWQHISEFRKFQQWILNTRAHEDLQFIIKEEKLSEETTVFATEDFEIDATIINKIESNENILTPPDSNDYESCLVIECDHCKELFHSRKALDAHYQICQHNKSVNKESTVKIINERDKYALKCETCGASFTQYGNLRRHIRKQHPVQPLLKWICKYCNKLFKKKSLLEKHKNRLHKKQASDNLRNIAKQIVDNKHNNVESSSTTEKCQEFSNGKQNHTAETSCSSRFSTKDDSEEEFRESDIIDAQFNSENQIQRPALEIIDIKSEVSTDAESEEDMININWNNFCPGGENVDDLVAQDTFLECPRCSEFVRDYVQLRAHFETRHPDERCYINCCHLTLYEQQSILDHLQFHENPNTFKCTECGKCFKGRRGLSSHKLQVHSDNRSRYHLNLCCCKTGVELQEQKLAKGQQMEYDTHVCCHRKKKILQDDELIAKWRKELICEICKANFPYYSLMRSHTYYEHPGEKCYTLCCQRKMSRTSDTLEHVRFHLNPHLYRCPACNVDFSSKSTLVKHMRNSHKDALPKHRWACDECDKTFEIQQILTRHKNVCHSKKKG